MILVPRNFQNNSFIFNTNLIIKLLILCIKPLQIKYYFNSVGKLPIGGNVEIASFNEFRLVGTIVAIYINN